MQRKILICIILLFGVFIYALADDESEDQPEGETGEPEPEPTVIKIGEQKNSIMHKNVFLIFLHTNFKFHFGFKKMLRCMLKYLNRFHCNLCLIQN